MKADYVSKFKPEIAQAIVDEWSNGCWEAVEMTFGKDKVYVIVHGKGPTDNIQAVLYMLGVKPKKRDE
jgi:hypothetical protein